MPSLSSRRHPLTLPADTLIEDFGVAGLGCGSRPYLLGVLFHPRAAEPRSVQRTLRSVSLRLPPLNGAAAVPIRSFGCWLRSRPPNERMEPTSPPVWLRLAPPAVGLAAHPPPRWLASPRSNI